MPQVAQSSNTTATYVLQGVDKTVIRDRIKAEMEDKFSVTSERLDFPLIFWNAKFHKDPIKFRPIAGSREKVLYPLEQIVGKIMKMITNHFIAYCRVNERQTGIKYYFAIKNSIEMKNVLNDLNGKAQRFDSYDFSNLYTNFKHEEILERLYWLIDLMFGNSKKNLIIINKNLRKAEYADVAIDSEIGWTFTIDKLKEAIKFLISNTYVEFGNLLLKQNKGIPMGSIPAPDFANLALAVDEYKYIKNMISISNYRITRKLNKMCRYLDDIGIPNFQEFGDITDIYPSTLTLTRSNDSGLVDIAFLDLSVNVINKKFETKIYCKTDDYSFSVISLPFLDSNVAAEMCYSVYSGQVLRFLRVCSKLEDFRERTVFLTRMLQGRSYSNVRLASKINQVLCKHKKDWSKFAALIKVKEFMVSVVYRV